MENVFPAARFPGRTDKRKEDRRGGGPLSIEPDTTAPRDLGAWRSRETDNARRPGPLRREHQIISRAASYPPPCPATYDLPPSSGTS